MTQLVPNNNPGPTLLSEADLLAAVSQLVAGAREYAHTREVEHTKRTLILAEEHVQVTRLKAASTALQDYFNRTFAERAQTNAELFSRLDTAMASGDPHMVHAVVRGIVELAQSSPLAGIEDFGRFWAELGTAENPIEL